MQQTTDLLAGEGHVGKRTFCLFVNQAGLVTSKLMALKLLSVVQQYFLNIQRVPGCELNSAVTQKTSEPSPAT